jgi:adapter protein MecA 1/2
MEIERINENTIKFYISYLDIENLGYEKEEIWYNRERSEQLFWHMMDQVNEQEDFNPEGPLWIQVQAMEKGLEIIVTKAKITKSDDFEANDHDDHSGLHGEEDMEEILDDTFGKSVAKEESDLGFQEDRLWTLVKFDDFEDLIQLSYFMRQDYEVQEQTLYHYKDDYYLYVQFEVDVLDEEDLQDDLESKMMEFAKDTNISLHVLEEYGKIIIEENTFAEIRKHFPLEK